MKWLLLLVLVAVGLLWWRSAALAADAPTAGDSAPAFTLPDQNGKPRSLAEFCNQWLVLYFYPRDDTPGCAEQAASFRDAMLELEGLGAAVCGISVDSSASHAAFARKYNLPFALLADGAGATAAGYGSLRNFGIVKFAKRNTFLIDPQGRVARVYLGVNAARNAREVVEDLKRLVTR